MYYPKWMVEEEQILREQFPRLSLNSRAGPVTKKSLLFLLPNKTWDAIEWKARQLNLRRSFKEVYPPLQLSDLDKGYIAGLVDGEGCISFIRAMRKGGYYNYFPYISIANTNAKVFEWLTSLTGLGTTRHLMAPPQSERTENLHQKPWTWSIAFTWQVSNCAAIYTFVTSIYSALKIKKEQAELLLEFLEIASQKPRSQAIRDEKTGFFIRRIPVPLTQRQKDIYTRMRILNAGFRKGRTLKQ